jgi:hypothetical protein
MKLMKIMARFRNIKPSFVFRLLQLKNCTITTEEKFLETWWRLVREDRMILTLRESYNIYHYLTATLPLGGAIAELGVYKGGGAKLISEFKAERPLHLFDTFQGMPTVDRKVDQHHEGDFADTSLGKVQEYLREYTNCFFHKGFFPDSAGDLPENTEFCFVHLDADIYESTLSGLKYFYPRLQTGGVIISHDYYSQTCPGVKRAFDEYFRDTPEEFIHLWDTQCMVKKRE